MIQIRKGVFETNSSSTHSITMCTKQEYEDWKAGKLYFCGADSYESTSEFVNNYFVTLEEAKDIIAKYKWEPVKPEKIDEEFLIEEGSHYRIFTYDGYGEYHDCMEFYDEEYVTPGGEHIVAFGYFGYDG